MWKCAEVKINLKHCVAQIPGKSFVIGLAKAAKLRCFADSNEFSRVNATNLFCRILYYYLVGHEFNKYMDNGYVKLVFIMEWEFIHSLEDFFS